MTRIIIAPTKYVQGKGELSRLGQYSAVLGKKALVVISSSGKKRFGAYIEESLLSAGITCVFHLTGSECSKEEIAKIRSAFTNCTCDLVIGVGGGKVMDSAKAAAHFLAVPIAIVPTVASSDAPCSALSLIYTQNGNFEEFLFLRRNPDLVLVDSGVICAAPVRLFVAGMGDALATHVEAKASYAAGGTTCAGGQATLAALALSDLCFKILLEDGWRAKMAVSRKVCTKAVENVIEANIYLSGLGFESGGLCAAHAINNGFSAQKECKNAYHGEIVAFGVLVQLILQNASTSEFEKVAKFSIGVGLPVTLGEIGIAMDNDEAIRQASAIACSPGQMIHNLPFEVNENIVHDAIITASDLGMEYKKDSTVFID